MDTKESPIKIIRLSRPVAFPSGKTTCLLCKSGSMEECREYAEKVAKEYGVTVEVIL